MECEALSQPGAQFEVKHLHTSYFSHTSPFIVVSASVNTVCPGAPRQWDQTETSFSLISFQAWRYDTAGTVRVQQKTVAGGHGWQGAGEELRLLGRDVFYELLWQENNRATDLLVTGTLIWCVGEKMTSPSSCVNNRSVYIKQRNSGKTVWQKSLLHQMFPRIDYDFSKLSPDLQPASHTKQKGRE